MVGDVWGVRGENAPRGRGNLVRDSLTLSRQSGILNTLQRVPSPAFQGCKRGVNPPITCRAARERRLEKVCEIREKLSSVLP